MTLYIRSCTKAKQGISITLMRLPIYHMFTTLFTFLTFTQNGITNDLLRCAHRSAVGGMNEGQQELSDRSDQRDFVTEIHPSRRSKRT